MKKHEEKTNVMRLLEQRKIPYKSHDYSNTNAISGVDVINALGENPDSAFKTLVTVSNNENYYVFLVPVSKELDLKLAAKVVNEKKIKMLKSKELLPLTGYEHGGCSPIGMKHEFPIIIDKSAEKYDTIFFSGGKIGSQIEMNLKDLKKVIKFKLANITK
ncbi:Cys-tRNA(Pro) deacylase [Methanobrevibacter wolinii]|uniref:Cys-tRNA(Pro) deacylase n=1 Tax=Methanobrevibacter wolinii TaxID=190977 RepID=UPI0005B27481|nr:Cys-tRNA(Pro) deacylase [Methanobrevibacter wolinii]MDD5960356.1 Cys-tRNA(Pro) deacylase [Methanobrevibacter wolinii]